jgi:hypothetical protein
MQAGAPEMPAKDHHGAMEQRLFRVTQAGRDALANGARQVPFACRRILGLLDGDTHYAVIRAGMAGCQDGELRRWLEQLLAAGLVESHAGGAERDLDFTGSLRLSALASAYNR